MIPCAVEVIFDGDLVDERGADVNAVGAEKSSLEKEENEASDVISSDAIVHPTTMMIKSCHTTVTHATMLCSWGSSTKMNIKKMKRNLISLHRFTWQVSHVFGW